ncbi:unnamed protein product [Didymodactylos carnosus]|uniref:DUF4371 domain-containing protein n=1 Tax=Didymodactylos carnosus TaxID=1234261 RepID=A0A8S2EP24_9BILA|nr:unnamed protein product [Didymodactylos carnosus]CAF4074834.1 unnamed protein product [Didymodactylos carnosus]
MRIPKIETTGEGLFYLLSKWLQELGLNATNIAGQCYDGASVMRGGYKGVAAHLQQISPKAIYIYCYAMY